MGVSDLAGSPFINLCLFGLLEFPGYAICIFTLDRVGRRLPLAGLMITGGLACLAMLVVPASKLLITYPHRRGIRFCFSFKSYSSADTGGGGWGGGLTPPGYRVPFSAHYHM